MSFPVRFLALSTLLSTLLAGGIASAQSLRVRTLALKAGEMPDVFLKGAKEHLPLRFSAVQPTAAIRALPANPLPLYKSAMDAKGKPTFVVAHRVKIPANAKEILLLGWTADDKPQYVAIKDDFDAARFNDWLLINTTSKPIAFKVGDKVKPALIAPGASEIYKVAVEKNKGAAVLAQAPVDGKATTFFSTYWPVHGDKRAVVLFVDDGRKIRVKRISDKLAAPKP